MVEIANIVSVLPWSVFGGDQVVGHLSLVPLVIWGFRDICRMTVQVMMSRLPAGACISLVFNQSTAA